VKWLGEDDPPGTMGTDAAYVTLGKSRGWIVLRKIAGVYIHGQIFNLPP
jgi:hypothetical protein